jgi:hypothetical protein
MLLTPCRLRWAERNHRVDGSLSRRPDMKMLSRATPLLFAFVVLAGCASTKVTPHQPYTGEQLARPDRILVYDFAATPTKAPADSAVAAQAAGPAPQTAEEIEVGRKLGAEVAEELVAELQGMELPAVQAAGPPPQVGDIVIKGQFVSITEGAAGRRVLVGFGSGAAELRTVVEGYQMTPRGLRRLGSGETDSAGGKTPGMVAPLAVYAATANPLGLVVVGTMKVRGERIGSNTIEGAAKRTADEIAAQLRVAAEKQGWI